MITPSQSRIIWKTPAAGNSPAGVFRLLIIVTVFPLTRVHYGYGYQHQCYADDLDRPKTLAEHNKSDYSRYNSLDRREHRDPCSLCDLAYFRRNIRYMPCIYSKLKESEQMKEISILRIGNCCSFRMSAHFFPIIGSFSPTFYHRFHHSQIVLLCVFTRVAGEAGSLSL